MELSLADLFEGERLTDLQLFEGVLNEANVAVVVLGILGGKVQFEDVYRPRVNGIDYLRIGHSIAEILNSGVFCLHLPVDPFQQFMSSHVHGDLI